MHHLPHGMNWEPTRLASVLSKNGVPACVFDSLVRIEIVDPHPPSLIGKLLRGVLGSRPNVITIKHDPDRFIQNINVDYDPFKIDNDLPHLHDITVALRECGYVVKSDREVAEDYCPDSDELRELFDTMERLQREKEDLVAAQDFEAAKLKRDEEREIRDQIDAYLFKMVD
ncbi:UvrB/UvrC motif-containing protein [Novipirellula sp. SH528]|uniref:UvrB/UvrC motif-containing protein n=1 Tax=Novipirellula sp. SH528 TaxID=3454466 RepID=UPI003F9FF05A